MPGQRFLATLQRTLPDGSFRAVVAGQQMTLALDGSNHIVVKDPANADLRKLFVEDEARFVDLARSAVFFTEEVEFPLPSS